MSATAIQLRRGGLWGGRRSVWIAILALSPLAYFGAARLERELKHHPRVGQIDKEKAIGLAKDFAHSLGIEAATWNASPATESNSIASKLLQRPSPPRLEGIVAP